MGDIDGYDAGESAEGRYVEIVNAEGDVDVGKEAAGEAGLKEVGEEDGQE